MDKIAARIETVKDQINSFVADVQAALLALHPTGDADPTDHAERYEPTVEDYADYCAWRAECEQAEREEWIDRMDSLYRDQQLDEIAASE